ncbi:hypothetical protein Asera_22670 [Actinocatenispora sera]|uniref:Helix-turn-helix domain-containing protein n=2 Tax=Actinocatenispora sera TaxID=390989 RepID=A0A810L065_9ACTN|nr:hypothetical protein Asera_22670 [Actinocatenispora sera]
MTGQVVAFLSNLGEAEAMTTTAARVMDEQTILPEATDHATVVNLLQVLRQRGAEVPEAHAKLIGADGTAIELPPRLHEVLVNAVEALANGYAITIAPQHTTLTTQQAADFLGVSRPTLTKMLEAGKIPFEKPNMHRRVKLADLIDYQQRRRSERRSALRQLTQDSIDMGLYDAPLPSVERPDNTE